MRVLHVESGMHLYGGARQVHYLLQGLQAQGVENILACAEGSAIGRAAASSVAQLAQMPMRGDHDLALVGRLRRLIRRTRPDLVHLHSRRGADTLGGLAAKLEGRPCVLSRRVDNPEPRWWVELKYRLYDHVITISEGIRRVLLAEGLPAAKVSCVHSAVVAEDYRRPCDRRVFRETFALPAAGPVAGMIAQLIPRKGHRHLLAALPRVLARHPDLKVLLFGQGPLEGELRRAVDAAGLAGSVRLVGFRDDLPRWLGCLDLVVHPADMEGLGVSLLQAAAAGVALIGTRVGGIPEIVREGQSGILLAPGDAAALAEAMIRLLDDEAERRRMGRAGAALVDAEFSVPAMVAGNLRVYEQVLGARHE